MIRFCEVKFPMTENESLPQTVMPQPFKPRKPIIIIGVLLVIAATGFLVYRQMDKPAEAGYLTASAVRGSIMDVVQATGTIEPVERAELQFKNSGDVKSITLQPGDKVSKGQVLAEQDDTSLLAQVRQSEITLSQQEIQIQNLTRKEDQAKTKLEQQQELFDGGFISQSALNEALDGYKQAELDLASAQAQLESSQAKLEMDRNELSSAQLIAPFSGIISAVDSQAGLSGGSSNSASLITLISEELYLKALVNEVDVGRLEPGQEVEFTSGTYTDRTFTGKLDKISPEATTVSNVNFYPVIIIIDNSEGLLRAGMSVNANIIIAASKDVLTIPMMAVSYAESYVRSGAAAGRYAASASGIAARQTAAADQAQQKVVLVLENNQPVQKAISTGLNDSQNIEVIEGLQEGDQIIIGSSLGGSASGDNPAASAQTRNNDNRSAPGMGAPVMIRP